MERNRRAQEESIKYREQLIKKLEEAKELTRREKEQEGELRTARRQELEAQVRPLARCAPGCRGCPVVPGHAVTAPFGLAQLAERLERAEQRCQTEEEEERAGRQRREELVRQEAERGYRSRVGGSEGDPASRGHPMGHGGIALAALSSFLVDTSVVTQRQGGTLGLVLAPELSLPEVRSSFLQLAFLLLVSML